jgi:uncharacterized membrane protein
VPDLAINLLASRPEQTSIIFQGTAGIVPFVVVASIYGSARFKGQAAHASLWALAGVAAFAFFSPILTLKNDVEALGSPRLVATRQAINLITEGARVSATNRLGGYLSERRYIYTFPRVRQSQWIIVDVADPTPYGDIPSLRRHLRKYESNREWQIAFSSGGIVVLHKRRASGT